MQDLPALCPVDHLAFGGGSGDAALTVGAATLTYAELEARVAELAGALRAFGTDTGDRIASWLPKTELACLFPLAVPRAGLVHVPINPLLKRLQVAHVLGDSGARLLVTSAERAALLEAGDLPPGCALVLEDELAGGVPLAPSAEAPDALAALLYTSGSSGRPKGVMLSHANLWLGALSVRQLLGLDRDTCTLCVLPLAFDYGQNQLLSTWAAGGHAVVLDYLLPGQLVSASERHRVNTLAGVPSLWMQLAEASWPASTAERMRCLTNSGGHLPLGVLRRLRACFPRAALHLMYGLTEAFRASSLDPALADQHPDAVGRPVPFAELFVLDPEGRPVPADAPGELVQAGPLVAQGYWRDPERTAERFRAAPAGSRYGGAAVWSGDTVVRDADGLLRVVGRSDALIKVAGNRISPTEIEEAAVATGLAAEAVAMGVPDPSRGAAIRLFVRGRGDGEALRRRLAELLPGFMQPATIEWVDRMPLSPNGKIDRAALRRGAGA